MEIGGIDCELDIAMRLLNTTDVRGEQNLNNMLAAIQRIRNARRKLKEARELENQDEQRKNA
ncbi:MAG: hypothetical protein IJ418_09120 [Clostridia bacterium]|nr:hypothetical protein [Clostridia bacterium]